MECFIDRTNVFNTDPDVLCFILDPLGLKTCSLEEPH